MYAEKTGSENLPEDVAIFHVDPYSTATISTTVKATSIHFNTLMAFFNQTLEKIDIEMMAQKALKCAKPSAPQPVKVFNCTPSKKRCPTLASYIHAMNELMTRKAADISKRTILNFMSDKTQDRFKAWCDQLAWCKEISDPQKTQALNDYDAQDDAIDSADIEQEFLDLTKVQNNIINGTKIT